MSEQVESRAAEMRRLQATVESYKLSNEELNVRCIVPVLGLEERFGIGMRHVMAACWYAFLLFSSFFPHSTFYVVYSLTSSPSFPHFHLFFVSLPHPHCLLIFSVLVRVILFYSLASWYISHFWLPTSSLFLLLPYISLSFNLPFFIAARPQYRHSWLEDRRVIRPIHSRSRKITKGYGNPTCRIRDQQEESCQGSTE